MNKPKKVLRTLLLCALTALLSAGVVVGLTSCGDSNTDTHTHTFNTSKWVYDDDFHWHAATCEHSSEKADRAPHNMVEGVCDVCGYEDDSVPKTYKTVTFNSVGGNDIEPMQFVVGKVMADLPVPTRKGYKFISWQERLGDEYTATSVMPDRDLYLIANWQKSLTAYTDDFVSFKPATEGCKDESLYLQYAGEVDKFIYLEITSDDLGGADKVGETANFNLRTMEGMDYTVKSGYTWAWYQGSFNNPNGAQRFTLNYGNNIQFVTISDSAGVVRQTYLVDLYVLRDYTISLYNNVYSSTPYKTVTIVENEYFPSYYETPQSKFDAADRVYFNSETGKYEKFIYSTPITKNWNLYQTYTYTATANTEIKLNLDGGTLEEPFTFSPYVTEYTLPVPVKKGYEFIGYKNSEGKFITDKDGNGGIKYLSETIGTGNQIKAAAYVSDEITAVYEKRFMYYTANGDGITTFKATRNIKYTDEYKTDIKSQAFFAPNLPGVTKVKLVEVGSQVSFTAIKAGHIFKGWYNGDELLCADAEFTFTMTDDDTVYSARYEAIDSLKPFTVEATEDTVKITGVKDTSIKSVLVPACVTQIDEEAFNDCTDIESISVESENAQYHSAGNCIIENAYNYVILGCKNSVIPDDGSIQGIENYAFYKCEGLTEIIIPDSVKSIGSYAFWHCTGLKSVDLGNGVKNIFNDAFAGCTNLTSITIPESVQNIYRDAFSYCYHLVEVFNKSSLDIAAGSTDNGEVANYARYVYTADETSKISTDADGYVCFTDGNVKSLVNYVGSETNLILPEDITEIHKYAFYGRDDIVSVTIPEGVTSIGESAFENCHTLAYIIIPDSVTSIGEEAFRDTGLMHVTIGSNVTSIGNYAFISCNKLIEIYNKSSLNVNTHYNKYSYIADYAEHIYTQQGQSRLEITNDKYVIYTDGSKKLLISYMGSEKNLTLPDGITEINGYAFENRDDITGVIIPDTVKRIGISAFAFCRGLTSIVIPDSVTIIDKEAFYFCSGLKSVTIGNGVTDIYDSAFYYCESLTSIVIPQSVTDISSLVFSGCSSLETIYCEAASKPNGWSSSWYGNCTAQIVWGYEG